MNSFRFYICKKVFIFPLVFLFLFFILEYTKKFYSYQAKHWEQSQCLLLNNWINKLCFTHVMEYYSVIKRNRLLLFLQIYFLSSLLSSFGASITHLLATWSFPAVHWCSYFITCFFFLFLLHFVYFLLLCLQIHKYFIQCLTFY